MKNKKDKPRAICVADIEIPENIKNRKKNKWANFDAVRLFKYANIIFQESNKEINLSFYHSDLHHFQAKNIHIQGLFA